MDATDTKISDEKGGSTAPISKQLLAKLRVIRTHRGLSVADALEKYGGPGIEAEYRRCVSELKAELGDEG